MKSVESANNGNYNALFGEIVIRDDYKLSSVPFIPDTVIDLGANVGVFTRHCRGIWPDALIISVEPNLDNFEYLKIDNDHPKTILINKAVGVGRVYRIPGALNGAHECYVSKGVGYSVADLRSPNFDSTGIKSLMLTDLISQVTGRVLLKVDIEANDSVIMTDRASVEMIKTFDYIVFEIHNFGHTHNKVIKVRKAVAKFIEDISETHNVILESSYLYATHKKYSLN